MCYDFIAPPRRMLRVIFCAVASFLALPASSNKISVSSHQVTLASTDPIGRPANTTKPSTTPFLAGSELTLSPLK